MYKKEKEEFIKYKDRCKSRHAGSSTCDGCDYELWLDDDPYKKIEVTSKQLEELNKGGSMISVGYKLNNDVKEKEDFKVDKLGWYESKNGEKFKVVHIKNNENRPVISFSESDECYNFSKEGFYHNRDMSSDCDLVKYLGPEITKQPRVFKFEAKISHMMGYNNIALHYPENIGYIEDKKYQITMKEILE